MSLRPPAKSSREEAASSPPVSVNVRWETFTVVGSTLEHLCRAIEMLAPRRAGALHGAYTAWEVRWSYAPARNEHGYRASDARVTVNVQCTLPRWRPPASTAAPLVDRWSSYLDALEVHEQGHIDLAVAAGAAVQEALQALTPCSSTAALERSAEETTSAVIEEFRRREVDYDVATEHGALQGVRLDAAARRG